MYRFLFYISLPAFLLMGCKTVAPDRIEESPISIPQKWTSEHEEHKQSGVVDNWIEDLNDPQLKAFIIEGLENNFSLQAAYARLNRAYANSTITNASKWPSLSAGFRAARNRRSTASGFALTGSTVNSFSPSIDLSWELDLWGRVRDSSQAALAELQAAQEVYDNARLSLAGNIAKAWISLIESKLQLELSEKTLKSHEANLEIIEENFKRGISKALDFQLSKSNLASTRSDYERRKRIFDENKRNFQSMLGRYPDGVFEKQYELPIISKTVPVGLPSELLLRRPDVVEAERQLAANSKQVSASKKALIPSIRLTGSAGTQSSELSEITNTDLKIWNIAANLTQPIFQGRRLKAGVQRAQANYEEALANYGLSILTAFREVETYLAADQFYEEEFLSRRISSEESAKSAEMAWEEFSKGLTTINTALESQRRAFNSQSSFLQVSAQRIISRINLHLALGGNFERTESTETQPE